MGGVSRGASNGFWKGGRVVDPRGYVLVRVGREHHLADCRGYAYEHRVVAEAMLGRRLLPNEHVHHRDENTQNNDPSNLEVMTSAQHRKSHRQPTSRLRDPGESNPTIACACGCGGTFFKYDALGRPRRFIHGHNGRPST